MKQTDRIRTTSYAGNQRARQLAGRRQNLFARFASNDALKFAYHQWVRMGTECAAEQIVRIVHIRYPVAQRLVDCIL